MEGEGEWLNQDATKPVCVTFRNLSFGAKLRGRAAKIWVDGGGSATDTEEGTACGSMTCVKPILKSLTGVFSPGKMTAIMGASGAGKTTLLKAIAGEAVEGVLTGDVRVNGHVATTDDLRRVSGFVFQDDLLMATMTVREAILFSARLRLPGGMSLQEKEMRVSHVIELLHLGACADTVIGSSLAKGGISGGEKKRVAIGMELVTNPPILFLDEPTTGLDTYTAYSVMSTLKALAESGRTVVATIHQPSSDIFHIFDNLIVLAEGHIVYQGPAETMVLNFTQGMFLHCPPYVNPADFLFMQVLYDSHSQGGDNDREASRQRSDTRAQLLLAAYRAAPLCQEWVEQNMSNAGEKMHMDIMSQRAGILEQISIIGVRNVRNVSRNPMGARAKIMQSVFMGSVVALIFHGIGNNQTSTQDRLGSLFFSAMTMMNGAFSVLVLFGEERVIIQREQALGLYSISAYFVTKVVTELPQNILGPLLQAVITFFPLGYHETYVSTGAEKFLIFASVVVLTANAGNGLGIFIASVFSDLRITLVAAPPMILPLMIFSGFFINTGFP